MAGSRRYRAPSTRDAPVALVTGGSSGIGEETARRLHRAGFDVYAVARRVDRMLSLEKDGVRVFGMDVTDDASMTDGVERVLSGGPRTVARTIVKAATASRPRTRYATGKGARLVPAARRLLPDRAFDSVLARAYF